MITGLHAIAGGSIYDFFPPTVSELNDPDWILFAEQWDKFYSELVRLPSESGYSIQQLGNLCYPQFTPVEYLENLAKHFAIPFGEEVLTRRYIRDGYRPENSGSFESDLENILSGRDIHIFPANTNSPVIWAEQENYNAEFEPKIWFEESESNNFWQEGYDNSIFIDIGKPAPTPAELIAINDYLIAHRLLEFSYFVGYIENGVRYLYLTVDPIVGNEVDNGVSLLD